MTGVQTYTPVYVYLHIGAPAPAEVVNAIRPQDRPKVPSPRPR